MGWFEEQVKKRQELDSKTFEDSFLSLAGIHVKDEKNVSDEILRGNYAITQILTFFRHQMVEIPEKITVFQDRVNYALRPYEITHHKIHLDEAWLRDNFSPILTFSKSKHKPLVLLPKGKKSYYFISYHTGKKVKVTKAILDKLEPEAYSFYRPLPGGKISLREYAQYIQKSIRPIDVILLIVFAAAVSGVGLLLPYFTKMLTGEVVAKKDFTEFLWVSIYVVAAATGLLLVKATQSFANSRIGIKTEKAIQEATMMRVLSLPTSFFKKYNTGELTSRFSSVSSLANLLINSVFVTVISVLMSMAYLFQLIGFAPVLIAPVVVVLIVENGFTIFTSFVQRKHSRAVLELASKEAGVTYEMINGVQKIRLSGSEKRVFAKWAKTYSRSARAKYRPPLLLRLAPAINLLISLLGSIAIYFTAARSNVSVGDYMAFLTSYGVLSGAFASLGQMVGTLATIQPLFEMARPILTTEPESSQGKFVLEKIGGNIEMKNVSFSYGEKGPMILDKLSLSIKEGEYVAIVGKTGCGKSTFVRLLLGFEKPTSGGVYYDGHNIEELDLPSLRRNIGTVMQNGGLFHADILSNIIISSPDLGEKEAWEAARIANIADDIQEMPMKMKTIISEGQGGISGGQKQRIMIARAIVHHPKILIFDEATSALDNKTQKSISNSIDQLNCTRIVIAHRLSTIKNADRILMLEDGKIVESGNYETLIALKGRFAELVERQRLDNNQKGEYV